ncbi:MAG: hypothetical protein KGD70_00020 [Candidatus Lokiarchaeota archaeon]|nr:hypothetical protein [Candidatus Lokiarchaeota archaeon]
MEEKRKLQHSVVRMKLNNGEEIETLVLLSNALGIIDNIPTSVEVDENYISFENKEAQKIQFHRVFYDLWVMEISFNIPTLNVNLKHKYLRTRTVKAIVINFFNRVFIGTFVCGTPTIIKTESRNQNLRKVIDLIDMKLNKLSLCKYCGMKLPYNLKEKCEFCGVELNFTDILLK